MKKVLFILIVASLSVFIYSACTKEAEVVKHTLDLEEISRVGEVHNQALDYLSENIDVNTASKEMYFSTIKEFFTTIAVTDKEKLAVSNMNLNTCNCDKKYTSIESWIDENNPNEVEKAYLLKYAKLKQMKEVTAFWDAVEKIETKIYDDSDENLDKIKLLGFSSILKHSFNYWNNVKEDENHAFHSKIMNHSLDKWTPDIHFYVAVVDALAYNDCLSNGGFSDRNDAINTCTGQSTYSSARAFD